MPGPFFSWIKKNTKKHIKHMGLVTWSKTCYPKKNTKTHKTHMNNFFNFKKKTQKTHETQQ